MCYNATYALEESSSVSQSWRCIPINRTLRGSLSSRREVKRDSKQNPQPYKLGTAIPVCESVYRDPYCLCSHASGSHSFSFIVCHILLRSGLACMIVCTKIESARYENEAPPHPTTNLQQHPPPPPPPPPPHPPPHKPPPWHSVCEAAWPGSYQRSENDPI